MTTYPMAPVEEAVPVNLARKIGVGSATIARWRRNGLSSVDADRVATKLGLYAPDLWPEFMTDEGDDDGTDDDG